jgi:hypothetical protein
MREPGSILREMLGDAVKVTVLGKPYDLVDEVTIPPGDLDATLYEHVERVMVWRRILVRCRHRQEQAHDTWKETEGLRFIHYYRELEHREREEMKSFLHDESEAEQDPFRRGRRAAKRVAAGVSASVGRWRRNFTDDLVWGHVRDDEVVSGLRSAWRTAKRECEVAQAVVDVLEHRMRCISHLCARDRTPTA